MVERKVYTWGRFTPEVIALSASYHSFVTGDANLDHLVKEVFFSHCKVTTFHLVIGKYFGENTLRV